ncbi:hypothetical protein SK224_08375 [Microbacterium sp. BG28]|uniref:hypothetical protein n=1 Tax=Microbacterium sp. BG28 TaxID=3097356 RepID=UPI002A5A60D9|nr:hypothetical protein [Microbacterium sp. BG28]MDY0829140.1 hypothetical protein [Microbacterium sp. BG28]
MVVRLSIFETRGGAVIDELEPLGHRWEEQSNTPETVSLPLTGLDEWQNLLTPWKHSLALEVDGRVLGGPIVPTEKEPESASVDVTARGFVYMLGRVPVLPLAALTRPLAPNGEPDATLDTFINGVDHGTIGKKLLQQQLQWPGWTDIPMRFHPDRPGSRQESYAAVHRKSIASAFSDLAGQQQGPDIRVRLERTGDRSFGWVYESGTEAQPRLQGEAPITWEASSIAGIGVRIDPSRMGSIAWAEGGRATDQTLIRMAYDPFLVNRGFPLLHLESEASYTTERVETLDSKNAETLRTARVPAQFWTFKVPSDSPPFPHEYQCGDLATLMLSPVDQYAVGLISARDIPNVRPRAVTRRIVGVSGAARADITITCGEFYG